MVFITASIQKLSTCKWVVVEGQDLSEQRWLGNGGLRERKIVLVVASQVHVYNRLILASFAPRLQVLTSL